MAAARDRGFTLLEVLVAFAIASLALAALFEGGIGGLGNVARASQVEEAVALARSRLSTFDTMAAPGAMEQQGEEGGGFHWSMQVAPQASLAITAPPRLGRVARRDATTLYAVSVTVSWTSAGRPASIRLQTQRLTPVPPPLP